MSSADDVVEDKAGDAPKDIIRRCRGRDQASTAEDDWEVYVADEVALPLELDEVLGERTQEADEEEVQ